MTDLADFVPILTYFQSYSTWGTREPVPIADGQVVLHGGAKGTPHAILQIHKIDPVMLGKIPLFPLPCGAMFYFSEHGEQNQDVCFGAPVPEWCAYVVLRQFDVLD